MKFLEQSKGLRRIVESAIIAAIYVVLTFFSASIGMAYTSVQLRLSEALTILPALTPFAVPGLTLGCLIANLTSPFGVIDLIFGTLATFLSALLTRLLRNVKFKGLPVLAPLPPVVVNAVIISLLICFSSPEGFSISAFCVMSGLIALGQFIMCYGLGLPLYMLLKKYGIFKD